MVEREKQADVVVIRGTKVREDVLSTDPDTISPLQRALDYQMTQTLFIGKYTLLLEGPSDVLFLRWFSKQLEVDSRTGLDYRWNLCVVGGVDRIPGFVSLFRGNGLHVAALVDVERAHRQRIDLARQVLTTNHLLTADAYAGQAEADIEDVLGRMFYVALLNAAYELPPSLQLPSTKPAAAPLRVAQEAREAFRSMQAHVKEYDHFAPAEFLYQGAGEGRALAGFKRHRTRWSGSLQISTSYCHEIRRVRSMNGGFGSGASGGTSC